MLEFFNIMKEIQFTSLPSPEDLGPLCRDYPKLRLNFASAKRMDHWADYAKIGNAIVGISVGIDQLQDASEFVALFPNLRDITMIPKHNYSEQEQAEMEKRWPLLHPLPYLRRVTLKMEQMKVPGELSRLVGIFSFLPQVMVSTVFLESDEPEIAIDAYFTFPT